MSVSVHDQSQRSIHISEETDNQLERLANERGISREALVEEALALLFHQHVSTDFKRSEWDILRQQLAEIGPSTARTVPSIRPDDIDLVVPVPMDPSRLKRPGDAF